LAICPRNTNFKDSQFTQYTVNFYVPYYDVPYYDVPYYDVPYYDVPYCALLCLTMIKESKTNASMVVEKPTCGMKVIDSGFELLNLVN